MRNHGLKKVTVYIDYIVSSKKILNYIISKKYISKLKDSNESKDIILRSNKSCKLKRTKVPKLLDFVY